MAIILFVSLSIYIVFLSSEVCGVQTSTLSPSLSFPTSLALFHSCGSRWLSCRWNRREAGGGVEEEVVETVREREEGGTWQWGDAEREISLSPSLLRGHHWAPETGACGSFTGSGCFLIHWLAMDVRRGQWREGRGRWCFERPCLFQDRLISYVFCVCLWVCAS